VDPRDDLYAVAKGKKVHHCPCRELNPGRPTVEKRRDQNLVGARFAFEDFSCEGVGDTFCLVCSEKNA